MCADSGIKRFRKDNYDILYYYDNNKELITLEYFDNIMCTTYKNHYTKEKFNMNLKFINNLLLKYFEEEYENTINDELKIEGNKLCLSLICSHEFGDFKFDFELVKCEFDDKKADKILMNKRIKILEDKNEVLRNKIEKLQEFISSCSLDIEIYENKYVKSDNVKELLLYENCALCFSRYSQNYSKKFGGKGTITHFRSNNKVGSILSNHSLKQHKYIYINDHDRRITGMRDKIATNTERRNDLELVKWNFEKLNLLNLNFLGVDCFVCDFKLEYVPKTVKILYLFDYQEESLSKKDMDSLLNKCNELEDIIFQNTTCKDVSFCNLIHCYEAIKDNPDINFTFVSMNYLKDGILEKLSNVKFEDYS